MTKKEQICETAYKLFKEKGYDHVTVDDICRACGIAKTTFYYHLNSKEDTLYPFYKMVIDTLNGRMNEILSAETYWKQLLICYFALIEESDSLGYDMTGKIYIANINDNKNSIQFSEPLDRIFVTLIDKAQKAGEIRNPQPVEDMYKAVAYAYVGLEVFWCMYKDDFDRNEAMIKILESVYDVDPEYKISYKDIINEEPGGGN